MKVTVLSANLGGYDEPAPWPDLIAPEGVEVSVVRLTDANFPPRPLAMTSRLQCGIPKWFGPDFAPDADAIIWMDASCTPAPNVVAWFLDHLGHGDVAAFLHPERKTAREEYEFMKARMARPGETYLNSRYKGEDLDGMMAHLERHHTSAATLYATTAFAYCPSGAVREAFAEVFALKARFLLHDQLAFAHVLYSDWDLRVHDIPENYLKSGAMTFTRTGKRRTA